MLMGKVNTNTLMEIVSKENGKMDIQMVKGHIFILTVKNMLENLREVKYMVKESILSQMGTNLLENLRRGFFGKGNILTRMEKLLKRM